MPLSLLARGCQRFTSVCPYISPPGIIAHAAHAAHAATHAAHAPPMPLAL